MQATNAPRSLPLPVVMADIPCLAACEWPAEAEQAHQYYRARYYDPRIGRFISGDPVGLDGGKNLYGYAVNGPVGRLDPLGLSAGPIPTGPPTPTPPPTPPCSPPPPDGCTKVPGKGYIWFGYNFEDACYGHDWCYRNCSKTKKQCDDKFYKDMLHECDKMSRWNPTKSDCYNRALSYYSYVARYAQDAFDEDQCPCKK